VVAIEDLSPATLEGVAARLRTETRTFVERVNRESELDALWTLADLAAAELRRAATRGTPPRPELPSATADDMVALAGLIFRAHDLHAVDDTDGAAEVMREAAVAAGRLGTT
jgi:hypothetical protein